MNQKQLGGILAKAMKYCSGLKCDFNLFCDKAQNGIYLYGKSMFPFEMLWNAINPFQPAQKSEEKKPS